MAILDTQILKGILEKIRGEVAGVEGSAIVSRDGLIMVSTYSDPSFNEKLGAMTTAALNPGASSLEELNLGNTWAMLILGTQGGLVIKDIDEDMVLVAVIKPGTAVAPVVSEMEKAVKEIRG